MSVGRNSECPCGSGKKYKACCGRLTPLGTPIISELLKLMHRGAFAEVEHHVATCVSAGSNDGLLWQLLAIAQMRQGRDGVRALQEAARCLPTDAAAQLNYANALARGGRLTEAATLYGVALTLRPDFVEAHANFGELQLERGEFEQAAASCARALAVDPESAPGLHTLAKVLSLQDRYAEAAVHAGHAVAINPGFAEAHNTLGNALMKLSRLDNALASFRRAITLQPEFAEARMNLAGALRSIGQLDLAAANYQRVLELNPGFAPAHAELATVLRLQRRSAESEVSARRAMDIDPKFTAPIAVLAELRADAGDFAQAEQLHRRIISMDEHALDSWAALTRLRRMSAADSEWLSTAQRLLAAPLPARRGLSLRYAIAKYFDDLGEFEQAFTHYRRANELSTKCGPPHDRETLTRNVDLIIRSQDRSWIERKQVVGDYSERPVFIVGMLRSGTTLAEQILASHPQVFGAGELTFFGSETSEAYMNAVASGGELDFSETQLRLLSVGYLRLLGQLSSGAARVVDKFPTNFFFLGLIRAVFPRARFIHMQRDPRDTCLSIYFQQFEAANTYSNDLQNLAHYYREYRRLMSHWCETLPADALLHVSYEGLVTDPESWSRRMVDFLGLPWHASCLDFHRTARSVVTASRWQVRQVMSTTSIGRWRSYERHLGPLAALRAET